MKGARTPPRRTWAEMDHDDALLLEEIVRRSRVEQRGPIAEFLAKKQAEQGRQTSSNYRTALVRFRDFLGEDATVGDVSEAAGFRYLEHLRAQGLADNSVATYLKAVKAFTRWMHKKGWTERDRFEDGEHPLWGGRSPYDLARGCRLRHHPDMLELFTLLLGVLRSALRRHTDLAVENLLLRHQLAVALRSRSRPRFRRRDKLL